jgi:hypothetical protein
MSTINKTNVVNGNTILANDILNVINALDGTASTSIVITADLKQGKSNTTDNVTSHAEGDATTATGTYSHAEGQSTQAIGEYSHAEGIGTIASGSYQHVSGKYNEQGDATSLFIVGNGTSNGTRKDAFKVTWSSSIAISTTQSIAPAWTGVDGEIVPATVGGVYRLYMWMNKAWRSSSFA